MPFDINIDPMVAAALEQAAEVAHREIIKLIEDPPSPDWEWRFDESGEAIPTRRKNGETVTSPRDIVDLGTLRDNQKWRPDGNRVVFYNEADHSKLVHEGGSNGNAELPGRPFITQALAQIDIRARVAEYLGYEIEEWATGTMYRDPATKQFTGRGLRGAETDAEVTDFDY